MMEDLRRPGLAMLNGDAPRVQVMAAWTDVRMATYGLVPGNGMRVVDVRLDWPHGTRLTFRAGRGAAFTGAG
jgi:hypothetical protein